jgi:hypothetical protein
MEYKYNGKLARSKRPDCLLTKLDQPNMKLPFILTLAILALLLNSGCATNQGSQQQSGTPTTVSGYVSVGAQKSFK